MLDCIVNLNHERNTITITFNGFLVDTKLAFTMQEYR